MGKFQKQFKRALSGWSSIRSSSGILIPHGMWTAKSCGKVSSGMLRRIALVRTDVSEEPSASFIRVTRIGELGTTQAATSKGHSLRLRPCVPSSQILVTLMKEALGSSETSVLTRATRRNVPEYTILHSHRRENLKSYIAKSWHGIQFRQSAASLIPNVGAKKY
jgi:hypothetical protein